MERSEIMEVVCEVADMAVLKHADVEGFAINVMVDGEMRYTEDAQVIFDGYYDNYDEFATKWVNKYPNTTQAELKQLLMEEAGLYTPPKPIEWSDCTIEFNFDPVGVLISNDVTEIYFEPGWYMWNTHTILNWKTMTSEFDFIYLIQATGERLKEDGTPHYPELYKKCDKGVVVRKLPREKGELRQAYESKHKDAFIIDVPGKVRISGEEFHFFEKVIREDKWMYLYDRENSVAYPIIPKVEYDAGAYDTNWLNRVLEEHNDLDFVSTSNVVGVAIKPQTVLFNKG